MKGLIFDIKRYAIHDGPGIRTTIFMKGCPLKCKWCHNPESISANIEKYNNVSKIGDKEFSREEEIGKYYSIEDLAVIWNKEQIFMEESNGGITFSGGEPLVQYQFLKLALQKAKQMFLHTAVDTSGLAKWETIEEILPYTDLFLFDIKHLDNQKHIETTGVSNKLILDNLVKIIKSGTETILRFPLIPRLNDDNNHINELIALMNGLKADNFNRVHILPFHKTGSSKYKRFYQKDFMANFVEPEKKQIESIRLSFESTGFQVKIGG